MQGVDGQDHINIYSQGTTKLGVFLSNFTHAVVAVEGFGVFHSIEALWYYLSTNHPHREALRALAGFKAKRLGRKLREKAPARLDEAEFRRVVCGAIKRKIDACPQMKQAFSESTLPFAHYYVVNGARKDAGQRHPWLLDFFETYRAELKCAV
jgi:hypothetical protein